MIKRVSTKGHALTSICKFVGISRQAYYRKLQKTVAKNNMYNTLEKVVIENRKVKSRAGLRTIYHKEGLSTSLGVNRFEQQMSARGHALTPYKSDIKTTDSRGKTYIFDNLIEGYKVNNENQVIVGDITYYQNQTGLYYIFQFTDYYTLEIKGLIGSKNMEGINADRCLRQVFKYNKQNKYDYGMIVHTDGGGQYRSHRYQIMLKKAGILPSQAKNCFENGLAERVNGVIKNEYLIDHDIRSVNHLNRVLKQIQETANGLWPSKTLGYKTPKQYADSIRRLNVNERVVKIVKIVQQK